MRNAKRWGLNLSILEIIELFLVGFTMDLVVAREEIFVTLFMQQATNVCLTLHFNLLNWDLFWKDINFILSFFLTYFIEREIPRDVFIKYRNENMRKNYLDEIAQVDSNAAIALAQAPFLQIKAYVD